MSDQLRGHGGHVRRVSAPRRVRADLEAENARLQTHIKVLDERGMQASLYVRLCYERDGYKRHMGEAWQEYRRLWLRWFEQRVEYRYTKKCEREAKRERDALQARVEEAEERAELLEKWVSHSPACGYGPSRYRQSDGCDCGLTAERAPIVVTSSNMSKGVSTNLRETSGTCIP